LKSTEGRMLALTIAILAAYLLLMDVIGFTLSTLLFIFGWARTMGYKKMGMLSIFSLVLTVALVLSFGKGFFVPLPRGIGIFKELSYLIY
jgi:putative tricarboxylic transport membrane protein